MAKVLVSARIDQKLVDFLDNGIESRKFASRTHGIELAIQRLQNDEKTKEK